MFEMLLLDGIRDREVKNMKRGAGIKDSGIRCIDT